MRFTLACITVLLALALPAAAPGATVTATGENLGAWSIHYKADPGEANDVLARVLGEEIRVSDAGAPVVASGECRQDGPSAAICPMTGGAVELGDGNDRLDWQIGWTRAWGGPGDDRMRVSGTVDGGLGADVLDANVVSYETRTAGVDVTPDDVANDGEPGEGDNVRMPNLRGINGGAGPDALSTTDVTWNMVLSGEGGADRLTGGPARDGIRGGPGDDYIDGRPGLDHLRGDAGADEIHGGSTEDRDEIDGGPGPDRVFGGSGLHLELLDNEADEVTCGLPGGAFVLRADPIDRVIRCNFSYLRFAPATHARTTRDGRVRLRVTCFATLLRRCDGAVRLVRTGNRTVLASGPFHLDRNAKDTVELKLSPVGRKLERAVRRLPVRAIAVHEVRSDAPAANALDPTDLDARAVTWVPRR